MALGWARGYVVARADDRQGLGLGWRVGTTPEQGSGETTHPPAAGNVFLRWVTGGSDGSQGVTPVAHSHPAIPPHSESEAPTNNATPATH